MIYIKVKMVMNEKKEMVPEISFKEKTNSLIIIPQTFKKDGDSFYLGINKENIFYLIKWLINKIDFIKEEKLCGKN